MKCRIESNRVIVRNKQKLKYKLNLLYCDCNEKNHIITVYNIVNSTVFYSCIVTMNIKKFVLCADNRADFFVPHHENFIKLDIRT